MDEPESWTHALFDEEYARAWSFPGNGTTAAELRFLATVLPRAPARILDVACGNGRHAIALASAGYEVTGVDQSAQFIELARAAATHAGVQVEFRCDDMRTLRLRDFAAALLLGNTFGYYSDADNLRALESIAQSVQIGGPIVVELLNRDRIVANFQPKRSHPSADGTTTIELDGAFDPVTGVNTIIYRWTGADGRLRERQSRQRLYTPPEITALLRAAGLRPAGWYDGYRDLPFLLHAERLVVVAERIERSKGGGS
jgi:SAM-dependent methyltransferase